MEKIIIKGLKLFAYHGVNPEEKVDGQNFILDITAELDAESTKISDDVDNTVSYAKIIKTVRAVFTAESYNLIETVANKVGMEYDPSNFLLMHAMGPNVSGVIGTAIAAGVFIATYAK